MQTPLSRALDALAVNNGCRWAGVPPDLISALHIQRMVDALQGAVPLPKVEVAVHGAARDQILGKSPLRRYSTGFAVGTLSDFAQW